MIYLRFSWWVEVATTGLEAATRRVDAGKPWLMMKLFLRSLANVSYLLKDSLDTTMVCDAPVVILVQGCKYQVAWRRMFRVEVEGGCEAWNFGGKKSLEEALTRAFLAPFQVPG